MAVVAGKKRQTATTKRMKAATAKLRKGRETTARYFTQYQCNECHPHQWIRIGDREIHRGNFHQAGGYEFEKRKAAEKARADALKAVQKAQVDAAKAAQQARPARPQSKTKPTTAPTKGSPAVATEWKSPFSAQNGKAQQNGHAAPQQAATQQQATASITEGIGELFRSWAMQTPPSIPASRRDAQATADMWRQIADSLRMRARMEQENNRIPEKCTEPMLAAAQALSGVGDQHMEVVRRIEINYGETAEILSRPDTPNADYLAGGR